MALFRFVLVCLILGGSHLLMAQKDPDPLAKIEADTPPVPLNMADVKRSIKYPEAAKEAGIEGYVVIRALVNKKGRVEKHILVKSPSPLLYEAVRIVLPDLRFSPASDRGKKLKFWVVMPFIFKLE